MASKINADEFVDREGEGKPTLPKGVVLSGVTTITTAVVAENEVANSTGINVGIITSTHFAGNLTGDVNAGIVTVTSQSVIGSAVTISASGIDIGAGVITATSYAGSGANLTGIGATIMVWEYNPDPYDTAVTFDTGIGITFNQKIKAGSGNITLSIANAGVAGTVVENFGIGNSVTITNNSLSIDPTSDLTAGQIYHLNYPSGVITNMAGESYVGTAYTFQARTYSYELYTWGANDAGPLGQNSTAHKSSPVQVPGTTWDNIGSGSYSSALHAAYMKAGTLWLCGNNEYGQLGQNSDTGGGSNISFSSPVQVLGGGSTWAEVAFGSHTNLAVKTDGTLWAWGMNQQGRSGLNTQIPGGVHSYSSPVQVGSDTTWSADRDKISINMSHGLAVKTDGTLWAWGEGDSGMLAQNNTTKYSSPVQIPGTTWRYAQAGYSNFATKTDGTLWSWGYNEKGQLGHNNTTKYSSPVQIPGTTWVKANSHRRHTLATKTDGTLWVMGNNEDDGQLGTNNTTQYSSPVQIPGTTWHTTKFEAAEKWSMAMKTDGTLWTWGGGGTESVGQLGRSAPARVSSPCQVGDETDWHLITAWNRSVGGIRRI